MITKFMITKFMITKFMITKFMITKFMITKFMITKFMITKFMITKFMITKFMITKFMITKFMITKFMITKHNFILREKYKFVGHSPNLSYSSIFRKNSIIIIYTSSLLCKNYFHKALLEDLNVFYIAHNDIPTS